VLYEVHTLKDADVKVEDLKNFILETKSFNPYDPHCICKKNNVKEYYPWIHRRCHWSEEDPLSYFCNSSRLNELVSITVEWKEALHVAELWEAIATKIVRKKLVQDKGKRKIVESTEVEQTYKFKEDPLVEKVALDIEVNR